MEDRLGWAGRMKSGGGGTVAGGGVVGEGTDRENTGRMAGHRTSGRM
jgi:hypothetical protein